MIPIKKKIHFLLDCVKSKKKKQQQQQISACVKDRIKLEKFAR